MIVRAICSIYDFPQLNVALNRSKSFTTRGKWDDDVPLQKDFPFRFTIDGHLTDDPAPLWKLALHDGFRGKWSYTQQSGAGSRPGSRVMERMQFLMFCFENETDMVYARMIANHDDIEDDNISFVYDNGVPE